MFAQVNKHFLNGPQCVVLAAGAAETHLWISLFAWRVSATGLFRVIYMMKTKDKNIIQQWCNKESDKKLEYRLQLKRFRSLLIEGRSEEVGFFVLI